MPSIHTMEETTQQARDRDIKQAAELARRKATKRDLWLELVDKVRGRTFPLGHLDMWKAEYTF